MSYGYTNADPKPGYDNTDITLIMIAYWLQPHSS